MTVESAAQTASPERPLPATAPYLRLVPPHEHVWKLRDIEYADGLCVRRYECDGCGEVDYS